MTTLSLISYDFDPSGFGGLLERLEGRLPGELAAAAFDLGERAERLVREAMIELIYATPERGYERTEALLRSAYGYGQMTAYGFDVVGGGVGGAEGRRYGDAVNRGTYGSRQERDTLLADARAARDFAPRAYPQAGSGMEARPFSEPAIAQVERELPERVLMAINRALG